MKTLSLTVSSFALISLSHCFSLLSAFLYSKPFRSNLMHCEIIDRYFNIFFVKIQLKKELGKCFLGARVWVLKPVYRSPKWSEYITAYNEPKLQTLGAFHLSQNSELRRIFQTLYFSYWKNTSGQNLSKIEHYLGE